MAKPVIKKSELISLINDKGYTRAELAEHYNVSVAEVNKYLKALNIKMRAKKMTYEVVDDTVETAVNTESVNDSNQVQEVQVVV